MSFLALLDVRHKYRKEEVMLFKVLLISLGFFIHCKGHATEYFLVDKVSIEAYQYLNHYDTYYQLSTTEQAIYGVEYQINTYLLKSDYLNIYYDSNVHFLGTDTQVRQAGLQTEFGFNVGVVDMYYRHRSDHVLDVAPALRPHFPLSDVVGIRIYFKY